MARPVLVTGGSGYIGSWTIVELVNRGFRVRTTVRSLAKADGVRRAVSSAIRGVSSDLVDRIEFVEADLSSDAGWDAALRGVDGVLHVASPLNPEDPDDVEAFVGPAVEGTLRVLRAAERAGVERVVLVSSAAACTPAAQGDVVMDDNLWTDPESPHLSPYRLSKVLAEKAAWEFAVAHPRMELATVLPGAVLGPALPGVSASSAQMVERMVTGRGMPAVPRVEMAVVDVRDVAGLLVDALERPAAAGHRFLAAGEVLTMKQVAEIAGGVRREMAAAGAVNPARVGAEKKGPRRVVTMPDAAFRLAAKLDKNLHPLVSMLGRRLTVNAQRAQDVLGWTARPARTTIEDTARDYLERA